MANPYEPQPVSFKGVPINLNYVTQMPLAQQLAVQENFKYMPQERFENFMTAVKPSISYPQDLELEKAYQAAVEYEFWTLYKTVRNKEMQNRGLNPENPENLSSFEAWKVAYQAERSRLSQPDSVLQAQSLLNDMVVDVRLDIEARYRKLTKLPNEEDELKRAGTFRLLLDNGEYFIAMKILEALEIAEPDLHQLLAPSVPETKNALSGFAPYYRR